MAGLREPVVPGETASRRMADAQRDFRARPAQTRSLNEMRKGGKVTFKKRQGYASGGDVEPASSLSARKNALEIGREENPYPGSPLFAGSAASQNTTIDLRKELSEKGLKGFRKGGNVKKTVKRHAKT